MAKKVKMTQSQLRLRLKETFPGLPKKDLRELERLYMLTGDYQADD